MLEQIEQFFKTNGFASGGLAVLMGGSIIGILWKLWYRIVILFNYCCFVSLSFESVDFVAFKKIQYWLYHLNYTKTRCRNFNIRYISRNAKYVDDNESEDEQIFYPGYGRHYIFLCGRPAILYYSKADSKELQFRETVDIKVFSLFGKHKISQKILAQINKNYDTVEYTRTTIHACTESYGGWRELFSRNINQIPIFASEDDYNHIVNDIDHFVNNEKWYNDRGIMYKRGYLLSGAPGNGKTSSILHLAKKFKKHIYITNLSSSFMDDARFIELVTTLPKDAILAIEDIDAMTIDRAAEQQEKEKKQKTVTLSTLLNVLDGVLCPSGLLFFLTTNYAEKLDGALVRKGRIDVHKVFNNANKYQAECLFKRFFPIADIEHTNKFTERAEGKSMSALEAHLIQFNSNLELATQFV